MAFGFSREQLDRRCLALKVSDDHVCIQKHERALSIGAFTPSGRLGFRHMLHFPIVGDHRWRQAAWGGSILLDHGREEAVSGISPGQAVHGLAHGHAERGYDLFVLLALE